MKRVTGLVLTGLIAVCVLSACKPEAGEEKDGKLKVMASFYTMGDFAQKAGGDEVEVTTMVPAGTEPHDWEPEAQDIAALEEADVFIYNGAKMEHWVKDVLNTLENKELIVVEAAEDIELLEAMGIRGKRESMIPMCGWIPGMPKSRWRQ